MYNTAECLLKFLNTKGNNYFIGNKVRDDIVNNTNKKKKKYSSISIISSLSQDEIQNLFKNSIKYNDPDFIKINFGLYSFKIFSFRFIQDNTLSERQKNNLILESLDYVREKKDFTINTLLMDENENIIDYTYKYKNSNISALNDLNNKIIRVIGNPKYKFKESPIRMLKAFRLMSTLGYKIENKTLESIKTYKTLLQNVNSKLIVNEFNKLIKGKNLLNTIQLMNELDFFNLKIENKYGFFNFINDENILNNISKLNKFNNISLIEIYAVVFKDNYHEIYNILKEFDILNKEDIYKIKWLVKNFDLILNHGLDLRLNIYYSIDDNIKDKKMILLKDLLNKLVNIHLLLNEHKVSRDEIMFALCSRPYFHKQLKITDNDLIKLYFKKYNSYNININQLKDKIIYNLIIMDKYPNKNFYEKLYEIL